MERILLVLNPDINKPDKISVNVSLVMMGGGGLIVPQFFLFILLLKISPLHQTLRPTCKFLMLGILYHDFFSSENLVFKKFYYINS